MTINKLLPGVKKNILLRDYTTFGIGGRARYFFVAKTKKDLIKAIGVAKKLKLPLFILGGGSNLLVSDKGFSGLVLKIENCKLKVEFCDSGTRRKKRTKFSSHIENCKVSAEAGVPLSKLVNLSVEKSLTGLEWATGIPGTVGGAVFGNAGAFGKSMADIIKTVEVLNSENFKIKIFKNKDCKFSYRKSIFKHKKNLVILLAELQFKKGNKKEIRKKTREYLNYKKETQPLNLPSAGSIFKNPQGFSAGWLIEKCDLKGKRTGNVKISEKHANFIVNLGEGKAKDVKKLINLIKKQVKKKFGIILEEEIRFL